MTDIYIDSNNNKKQKLSSVDSKSIMTYIYFNSNNSK